MRLQGKRCLVTGGSGGLGAATCRAMAREGARGVAVHYSSGKARAEDVAAACRALGAEAFAVQADVARRASCEAMVRQCVERWGGLDALVCYAGDPWRAADWDAGFLELRDEAFGSAWAIDFMGSVHAAQAAIPAMRGGGRIVLTSSSPALTGDVEGLSYLPAKAAVAALARSLARLYGKEGIAVNAIAPGSVRTPAMRDVGAEGEARLAAETALRRLARPEEVAALAVFLCSDEAAFLTGSVVAMDGGLAYH